LDIVFAIGILSYPFFFVEYCLNYLRLSNRIDVIRCFLVFRGFSPRGFLVFRDWSPMRFFGVLGLISHAVFLVFRDWSHLAFNVLFYVFKFYIYVYKFYIYVYTFRTFHSLKSSLSLS
jgi:hypothetical protein